MHYNMKKSYKSPKMEIVEMQPVRLLQASGVNSSSYNIWYGGVDYGSELYPE